MLPLILSLVSTLLIAFLAAYFGFRRANSLWKLTRYAIVTTMAGFILLIIGVAFLLNSRAESELATLPLLLTIEDALRAEKAGESMVLQGRLSAANETVGDTGYVAYVRSGEDGSAEFQLPELLLELRGGEVEIEQAIYEQYSWNEDTTGTAETTRYLLPNDEVIVYGRGYLGESVRDGVGQERLFLSAPFVFQGNAGEFVSELIPTLRRQANIAQVASIFSLIAATVVLLSPLPKGLRLLKERK